MVTPLSLGSLTYPPTRKEDVVDTYGDGSLVVHDPYRWLEDGESQEVKDWSNAQNLFARKLLDALPSRAAIGARIEQLSTAVSPAWTRLKSRGGSFFALERMPPKQNPFLVVRKSLGGSASAERILVDPNLLDPSGKTHLDWFVPSFDGRKVAVSLSSAGAEQGDIHVFDVATAKEQGDVVPQADGIGDGDCLAWTRDGSGFYYTRNDGEKGQRLWLHRLGHAVRTDVLAVGAAAPSIAQWEVVASQDGRSLVARMEYGDGGEYDQWVQGSSGTWRQVATRGDGVLRAVAGEGDALYLLVTKDAPRGKVLLTSLSAPALDKAQVVVPEGAAVIDAVVPTRSRLFLVETVGGPAGIRSLPLPPSSGDRPGSADSKSGEAAHGSAVAGAVSLATPLVSSIDDITPLGGDDVAFSSQSYTEPSAWYRASGDATAVTKTSLAGTASADFSGIEVLRDTCISRDGTRVPLNILRPKGLKLDGTNPTLFYGYGGFGTNVSPLFQATRIAWLEQGGVYAAANLRGGGEFGEDWHRQGSLERKQNVFDDFAACATRLQDTGYTSPAHLAIIGTSNGGLLMGAELVQHPQAWKAVVSYVGIYDVLRVERDANGMFNVTEFGSVKNPQQLRAMAAYSPYQHVQANVAYPATLFLTGINDPRVNPYHSRKMTARLQAATSSRAPILLRTSTNTGHGVGTKPLRARVEELTDVDAFLFDQLGVAYHSVD